jgi:hypothetical protein
MMSLFFVGLVEETNITTTVGPLFQLKPANSIYLASCRFFFTGCLTYRTAFFDFFLKKKAPKEKLIFFRQRASQCIAKVEHRISCSFGNLYDRSFEDICWTTMSNVLITLARTSSFERRRYEKCCRKQPWMPPFRDYECVCKIIIKMDRSVLPKSACPFELAD